MLFVEAPSMQNFKDEPQDLSEGNGVGKFCKISSALIDMLLPTDRELLTFLTSFLLFFFSNLTLVRHGRGMFVNFFQNVKVQSDALETPLIF